MPAYSIELIPPRNESMQQRLEASLSAFSHFNPSFYSIAYGVGGSTALQAQQAIETVQSRLTQPVCPHVVSSGLTRNELKSLLESYQNQGIRRLLPLKGDASQAPIPFEQASDFIAWIREEFGPSFHLSAAAYPETHPKARSPEEDLAHLKIKVDAGVDALITQYFFNVEAFEDFYNRCAKTGINVPIYPGILPIGDYPSLKTFSNAHGVELPRWLERRLSSLDQSGDHTGLNEFGLEFVLHLCEKLRALNVPGFHFYSLNRHEMLTPLLKELTS